MTEDELWVRLNEALHPFAGYPQALAKLSADYSAGYALAFAYNYVDADICNGGVSGLNRGTTWHLVPTAVDAARIAGYFEIERLLKEIVLYYHERGRSRMKKLITDDYFAGIDRPLDKSLSEIEDEWYALADRYEVIPALLGRLDLW